jgi:hypothetical protein
MFPYLLLFELTVLGRPRSGHALPAEDALERVNASSDSRPASASPAGFEQRAGRSMGWASEAWLPVLVRVAL